MAQIGKMNQLKVLKEVDFGLYLDGEDLGEILLPVRYMPESFAVGDTVDVFLGYDSDDRLMATTDRPLAQVGEFAFLKVVAVEQVGAFLDWGLSKDLLLPFREQTRSLRVGERALVFIYLDNTHRLAASMRLDRHMDKNPEGLEEGQEVELQIATRTDLGFKAIINGRYGGVIYENEIFKPIRYGEKVSGFIKKIRDDGKIDLSLTGTGHKAADDIGPKILELLKQKGGFLDITDKTPPEVIYRLFGASKKKFKIALGGLYKTRQILVEDGGIRLVVSRTPPQ